MAKPILYRPAPKWQFWTFLGGALFIHGVAVLAAIKHEPPPVDVSDIPTYTIEATMEQPTDEPTPPPEDIPLPEPPPMPDVQPEFHEETTPPPKRPPNTKVQPVKAPQIGTPRPAGTMSISSAKAVAINTPRPEYPYEARSRHITGSGVCVVSVDASGVVTDATMASSCGNAILDNSATSAFKRWRFKAGATPPKVRIPITFTMTGASY